MCNVCDGWQALQAGGSGPDATARGKSQLTGSSVVEGNPQPYVLNPSRWARRTITWSNASLNLSRTDAARQRDIQYRLNSTQVNLVRQAFAVWEAVANVDFREVRDSASTNIRIGLGATGPLGARLGPLAYARNWWIGRNSTQSAIAMDAAEPWNSVDFFNVMLHEIGHAIGLAHSPIRGTVMYSNYDWWGQNTRMRLHQDDINGVRALYPTIGPSPPPARTPQWPPRSAIDVGDLSRPWRVRTRSGSVHVSKIATTTFPFL